MSNCILYLLVILSLMTKGCDSSKGAQQATGNNQTDMPSTASWLKEQYNNVVEIEQKHVARSGDNFLVDIPLTEHPDSGYVFFLNAAIPVNKLVKLEGFYPGIKELTIIVPDWKFYEQVAADATKNGIMLEPATTNLYYHVIRENDSIKVDSIRISGDGHPQLQYQKPAVPKDMLVVYRTESYGSVCCPKDPRWEIADEDPAFVKEFEQRYQTHITETYRQNNGKEGEHSVFILCLR
ncbi:hypothetical protein [Niabella hibiscisoli]|uniref:hypothetical protein n=1 Tax=Niabella hibiscisoli TaxID=1825928 RepID=UPI001F0F053E|nr:hypothetical protein [Niabella hibiscisoli]MCH5718664.1 hypothetical protein [Niabella hibiscisoli]